ncbi:MAG TPA: hypothetical protein VJU78_09865, partial [Chitinophagaceae bacterium]|nr:hypothetical protein [Chitinophagaceae bacterium]
TFCYVDDNLDTTEKILYNDLAINEILNLGSDKEMTILELAQKVIELTKTSSSIIYLPALKEGDMTRRCPDISKMKDILNRELISLEEGINKTAEFVKKRIILNGIPKMVV